MKTALFDSVVIGFLLFLPFSNHAQGWMQIDDFPSSARDDGTSFTIGTIAYCGSGLNATWNATNDFHALDLSSDSWSSVSGFPANEARQYANGFSSDTEGFLFGGLNSSGYLNDVWKYNPVSDSWSELTPMPSLGRSGAACFVIGDTAYFLGGQTQNDGAISEVWAYSISNDSWTQKNDLPDSLWRASAISHQDKGYLVFGVNNSGLYQNKLYEYSPATDSWTPLSDFPGVGRSYSGMSILNDQIVLVAGRDSIGNSYNDMWRYSITSDDWNLSVNLPSNQRRGGICFSTSTAIYYTTGIDLNDVRLTETWKYDLFLSTSDEKFEELSVYPNPARDFLQIEHASLKGILGYQIYSIDGTTVRSGELSNGDIIPLDGLQSGNYLISIQSESGLFTKKIVIL